MHFFSLLFLPNISFVPCKRKLFSILRSTAHLTADLSGISPSEIKYMFFTTRNSADNTGPPTSMKFAV